MTREPSEHCLCDNCSGNDCEGAPTHEEIRKEEREGMLEELATFLDNADNTSDSGNAQKWVSVSKLSQWMKKNGWQP